MGTKKAALVAFHPSMYFRLKTQWGDGVFLFSEWVRILVGLKSEFLLSSLEKEHYLKMLCQKNLPQKTSLAHFPQWTGNLIKIFKNAQIDCDDFEEVLGKMPLADYRKKEFQNFLKIWRGYEKKPWPIPIDDEDLLKEKIVFHETFKKVFLLTLNLTYLERHFLKNLAKKSVEIEYLSPLSQTHSKVILAKKADGEEEVSFVVEEIKKCVQKGVSYSSIYIFHFESNFYLTELKYLLSHIKYLPYSDWTCRLKDLNCVSILPWNPSTMILEPKAHVFILGLSHIPKSFSLVLEEEKGYFNQEFQKNVFQTAGDKREEIKQCLAHLIAQSQACVFTYNQTLSAPFAEFFQEYTHYSLGGCLRTLSPCVLEKAKEPEESQRRLMGHSVISMAVKDLKMNTSPPLPKVFSARSLEQYQRCSYGFLMKECFGLKMSPKISVSLTNEEIGELIHFILKGYFIRLNSKEEEKDILSTLLQETFKLFSKKFQKEILECDRDHIGKIIAYFLEKEKTWEKESSFRPHFFELTFGMPPQEKTLILKKDKESLAFRGRIDRVDIDERKKMFKIIDYKTGSQVPSSKEVLSGKHFQLVLYAMAIESIWLPDYWPSEAFFYLVKSGEMKKGFQFDSKKQWEELKEKVISEIFSIKKKLDKGEFLPTPSHCYSSCELRNICENA